MGGSAIIVNGIGAKLVSNWGEKIKYRNLVYVNRLENVIGDM